MLDLLLVVLMNCSRTLQSALCRSLCSHVSLTWRPLKCGQRHRGYIFLLPTHKSHASKSSHHAFTLLLAVSTIFLHLFLKYWPYCSQVLLLGSKRHNCASTIILHTMRSYVGHVVYVPMLRYLAKCHLSFSDSLCYNPYAKAYSLSPCTDNTYKAPECPHRCSKCVLTQNLDPISSNT